MVDVGTTAISAMTGLVCGSAIGAERQARGHDAGLHTNALVALGAAAFIALAAGVSADAAARMAAQVVTGIGFLGAGLIWRRGFSVRGLNTAATVWCSAAAGVAAGFSALWSAFVLTAIVVVANTVLHYADRSLKRAQASDPASAEQPSESDD